MQRVTLKRFVKSTIYLLTIWARNIKCSCLFLQIQSDGYNWQPTTGVPSRNGLWASAVTGSWTSASGFGWDECVEVEWSSFEVTGITFVSGLGHAGLAPVQRNCCTWVMVILLMCTVLHEGCFKVILIKIWSNHWLDDSLRCSMHMHLTHSSDPNRLHLPQ